MTVNDVNVEEVFKTVSGQHSQHRSPFIAGDADRYYGRPRNPNFCVNGRKYTRVEMTDEQIKMYHDGYDSDDEVKDWG